MRVETAQVEHCTLSDNELLGLISKNDKEAFDGKLEFDLMILPYEGDDSWIAGTLKDAKACLVSEKIPDSR